MEGQRDRDRSRSSADVKDLQGSSRVELGEGGFNEVFSFWAGDEDGWAHVKGEAIKLLFAGDVLDWFVGEAAENCSLVCGLLIGGEQAIWVGVIRGACEAGDVE